MTKQCSKCKLVLDYDMFYHSKNTNPWCKNCQREWGRSEKRRKYNRERGIVRNRTEKYKKYITQYHKNPKYKKYLKEYMEKYSKTPKFKENKYIYEKNKLATDIRYRLEKTLRARLRMAIKDNQKTGSAIKDLGCTIPEFMIYIEKQFLPGMTWSNRGLKTWHLDHKKPMKSFNLLNRKELLEAVHYTNFQPLWAKDNWDKGSKVLS